jgi:hypothetical protein
VWLTWRNELNFNDYLHVNYEHTAKIVPDVPAVAAISPGCRTFNEKALFG